MKSRNYIENDVSELPDVPAALVLGAGVSDRGILSAIFKERVDAGLELYQKGKVKNILISGDNSTEEYNEVSPVRLYLLDRGVPEHDIYLDFAGFNTYNSVYRAQAIFQINKVIIVSQKFHLYRAIYLARSLGIDAYGYPTEEGHSSTRNIVRESLARVKSFAELMLGFKPKFLGEEIPVK
ncbi:MAG TPA: ElyC/SanA/YdcF family protein [Candidatus Paceibacterota bacterium]|nr:ElyC/SanA/YdcF family protein [Candidatus Paceibacterota bacterium]